MPVAACSRRFAERAALACHGCALGAHHVAETGTAASVRQRSGMPVPRSLAACISRRCLRCERPAARLLYGALCISCCNRQLELVRGRNGRGSLPRVAAERLRHVVLEISGDAAGWPCAATRGGPRLAHVSAHRWRVEWLASSESEAREAMRRWLPDAEVLGVEVGPPLLEEVQSRQSDAAACAA